MIALLPGEEILQTVPPWFLVAAAGVVLLLFGRRLYWALLGLVGFALGFSVLTQFVASATSWAPWLAGIVGGALGIAAAVLVQGALLAVVGAVLGAFAALVAVSMLVPTVMPDSPVFMLVAAILGAIAGSIMLRKLFFATLILVTSLSGARLVIETLTHLVSGAAGNGLPMWAWDLAMPGPLRTALFAGLVIVGVVFQASGNRKDKKERRLRKQKKQLERDVKRLRKERQGS